MGFWDGVGDFFSEYGDDLLVGAASVAGFVLGGPPGAALLGGAANGISAAVKGENVLEPGLPESFNVMVKELQSLALDVELLEEKKSEAV